ncbi:beta-ketoacyl synthase N-terminal-like domain-containing protein [Capnocytophaga periodontitidis]|uniref:beta-ketoacyl synthase N-terminal-like domain-containing protein n=1 Tax=Capnocytophaga periodontitidis TaxID=2795027 RepID=UPI0018E159E0|nr:beta-ketoacyl synthase N-terminal-like domain-containing protein [Capnocytophaga periodontitidis]MBI1668705.1 beta-ketoacyl synthase [Capnocytophaga periodontitidis]
MEDYIPLKIAITGMSTLAAEALTLHNNIPQGKLSEGDQMLISALQASNPAYEPLDTTVLYALHTAREAVAQANWHDLRFGINIGSSRGATALFEKNYSHFLAEGTCQTLASPTTTLGNISTWVAQDLGNQGFELSHSITCSTALHGIANAIAWLESGMEQRFLVGGSEAPLTPFTIAQVKALKIYSSLPLPYPCRAMDMTKKQSTMVLGEGAGCFCLEKGEHTNALAHIVGIGFATEKLTHSVSLSKNGDCLQASMQRALASAGNPKIDAIITHCTGTIKGDQAELNAIEAVFGDKKPLLTNNKWQHGHTYGASGALNLAMAVRMLQNNRFEPVPYLPAPECIPDKLQHILINAVGFGGNGISVVVSR